MLERGDRETLWACTGPDLLGPFGLESNLSAPLMIIEGESYGHVAQNVDWPIRFVRTLAAPATRQAILCALGENNDAGPR